MAIFTSLSTFKKITLTVPKRCAGCDCLLKKGTEVPAKFTRNAMRPHLESVYVLCPDSVENCWSEFDYKYWNAAVTRKEYENAASR